MKKILHNCKSYFAIKRLCRDADFIMLNVPEHENLGDHAIAIAEKKFMSDFFPSMLYKEVSGDYYRREASIFKRCIKPKTIIGISGGGYLGDMWMDEEKLVRDIISSYPNNKIIIFPQTVYYHDNDDGNKEWEISKKIYSDHCGNLSIFLREQKSYDFFKTKLPQLEDVYLVPDMVLYLDKSAESKRSGIRICLREDKEKCISDKVVNITLKYAEEKNIDIKRISTVLDRSVGLLERDQVVQEVIDDIASAELVVTDRLHAMLFSAITGTPCIAFDNATGKVSGVAELLKDYSNILITKESYFDIHTIDLIYGKPIKHMVRKKLWTYLLEKIRQYCNEIK